MRRLAGLGCTLLAFLATGCQPSSEEVAQRPLRIAVTASFAPVQAELAAAFSAAHGVKIDASVGSTGRLFAQIENGAPFDIFLAADTERPRLLEEHGHAISGSRFTYASGRLALYAPQHDLRGDGEAALRTLPFTYLAIADPELAPYGSAAQQVLEGWGLWQELSARIVRGTNVAQALHFVESGGADLGLVAWPLVRARDTPHTWLVPSTLHMPIEQQAVAVRQALPHSSTRAFLEFLRSPEARRTLEAQGYDCP